MKMPFFINQCVVTLFLLGAVQAHAASPQVLLRKARGGDVKSMRVLGKMLYDGTVVKRDIKNAIAWFRKASDAGDHQSMLIMGDLYYDGAGVSQNKEKAAEYYIKADKAGNKNAAKRLRKLPAKYTITWLEDKANNGDRNSAIKLLQSYATGGNGIKKDLGKACKYYALIGQKWPDKLDKACTSIDEATLSSIKSAVGIKEDKSADNDKSAIAVEESTGKSAVVINEDKGADNDKSAIAVEGPTGELIKAANSRKYWLYEDLIKRGADVNHEKMIEPLFWNLSCACQTGEIDSLGTLLKLGADLNAISERERIWEFFSHNAYNVESYPCCRAVFEWIIKNNIPLKPTIKEQQTPLHVAVLTSSFAAVKALIESGADLEARDHLGSTPLLRCTGRLLFTSNEYRDRFNEEDAKIFVLLLQNGANPNKRLNDDESIREDCRGGSSLSIIASNAYTENHYTAFTLLLQSGGNPFEKDSNGHNTLERLVIQCKDDASRTDVTRICYNYLRKIAIDLINIGVPINDPELMKIMEKDEELVYLYRKKQGKGF